MRAVKDWRGKLALDTSGLVALFLSFRFLCSCFLLFFFFFSYPFCFFLEVVHLPQI